MVIPRVGTAFGQNIDCSIIGVGLGYVPDMGNFRANEKCILWDGNIPIMILKDVCLDRVSKIYRIWFLCTMFTLTFCGE
jgi:hypothetical protein